MLKNFPKIQFGKRNKRLKQLNFKNYSDYLSSDFWKCIKEKFFRKQFKNEYWKKCFCCGINKNIILHHIKYTDLIKPHFGSHLFPVCWNCHQKIHELVNKEKIGLKKAMKQIRKYQEWHQNKTC